MKYYKICRKAENCKEDKMQETKPTTKTKVIVNGNKIAVYTTFALRETAKQIPGRRWDNKARAWIAPATAATACAVLDLFGTEDALYDQGFQTLVAQSDSLQEAQAHKTSTNLPQPAIRKTDAWRHQLQAYHFAMSTNAVMLDMGMGTGKTKVCIDIIVNSGHKRVLVSCPKSVVPVWGDEIQKHAGIDTISVYAEDKRSCAERSKRMEKFLQDCERIGHVAVVVVNHEAVWRDEIARVVTKAGFDLAIVDESHRIKSPSGKASRFFARLGEVVPNKICLTGTPTPHSPLDIYGQYRFLDKGVFGTSFAMFRARYAVMGGYGGHEVKGYHHTDELRQRVDKLAYHVGREVLDLPEATHTRRKVELGSVARKAYKQMEKDFYADMEAGRIEAVNALARLLRLQQITSGYLPIDDAGNVERIGGEKRAMLADVLEDLDKREPVVVFAKFRHDLDEIRAAAEDAGRTYAELSGRLNTLKFWQDGGADVIGVQIQAGGVGINLTRARYCVYYSVGFSLGDYEQSLARAHRPGQKHPVTYVHLIAENTVDEKVYEALANRKDVIDEIFGRK